MLDPAPCKLTFLHRQQSAAGSTGESIDSRGGSPRTVQPLARPYSPPAAEMSRGLSPEAAAQPEHEQGVGSQVEASDQQQGWSCQGRMLQRSSSGSDPLQAEVQQLTTSSEELPGGVAQLPEQAGEQGGLPMQQHAQQRLDAWDIP